MSGTMKLIFCFVALALILSASIPTAYAADSSRPRGTLDLDPQQDVLELLDQAPKQEEQKTVPEPQTINDFANQYYGDCVKQGHPILRGVDLELMCGCASAQISENMTVQQMQERLENTEAGQQQRSRMLLFVYTPCIQYPIKSYTHRQCVNDPEIKFSMKYYEAESL
mgnify:CR=1 FL=1